jgi:phage shock protein PspC (stress-responsive transcriptional regulator)
MNRRSLYRCRHDRRIAGVAAGVAEFFDLDPTLVRLVWFLSIFFGGFGLLLYIVMAIIVPNEPLSDEELRAESSIDAASPHRHAGRSGNGGVGMTFVGIALIAFGALALANTFFVEWGYSGSFLWPGFILAIGVLLLAAAFRRGEPEPTDVNLPPAAPAPPASPAPPAPPAEPMNAGQ